MRAAPVAPPRGGGAGRRRGALGGGGGGENLGEGGEETHYINNREAPRKVLVTLREETNRGVAGAFLTIIDTTYARQFPPTHQ